MMTSEGQSHRRLGDFEIVREIGRSGMGIVYKARQASLSHRIALETRGSGPLREAPAGQSDLQTVRKQAFCPCSQVCQHDR